MKYLEDARLTRLTSDLMGASLNTRGQSAPASGRVLHGRVEAYTTKRTSADKKTAVKVGLQYAHEMELFNEAVEACRKKRERPAAVDQAEEVGAGEERTEASGVREQTIQRRRGKPRSCSVDGVTFAMGVTTAATAAPLMSLTEGTAVMAGAGVTASRPLEGILKPSSPPGSKRCRATSFDVSASPSFESSTFNAPSRGKSTNNWGNVGRVAAGKNDRTTYPLIPQPSLYHSSNHDARDRKPATTMVPRRLVTDLILTLNAAFPDYDFASARVSDFCTLSTAEAARRIEARLGEFVTTERGAGFLPRLWRALEDVATGGPGGGEVYSYAPRGGRGAEEDPLEFLTRSLAAAAPQGEGEDCGATADASGGDGRRAVARLEEAVVFSPSRGKIVRRALDGDPVAAPAPSRAASPCVTLWALNYFFVSCDKKRIVLFACVQTVQTPRGVGGDVDGDESVRSIRAEDTDVEEDVDVEDADGEEAQYGGHEFDTGRLRVPSWVA